MPSIESFLRDNVSYDPTSGTFSWIVLPLRGRAKLEYKHGAYKRITSFDGQRVLSHRAAWFMHYGAFPDSPIDHIDGNPSNNAIANLRIATAKMNSQNRYSGTGASGFLGVTVSKGKSGKPYRAGIRVDGKQIHLGYYPTSNEAHQVYLSAKKHFHSLGGEVAKNSPSVQPSLRISVTKETNIYPNKKGFQVKFKRQNKHLSLGTYKTLALAVAVRNEFLSKQVSDEVSA